MGCKCPILLPYQRSKHRNLPQIFSHNIQKDVTTLSQLLQCILLSLVQYKVCTQHKPRSYLHMADWLLRQNHTADKDEEMKGKKLSIDTIKTATDIPSCISNP